jgi:hypothetical protein
VSPIETLPTTAWNLQERTVTVRGAERRLRLVRFERGWLASVDTVGGPTLGADRSPYLAAWRALDPLGVELAEVMLLLGPYSIAGIGPRTPSPSAAP